MLDRLQSQRWLKPALVVTGAGSAGFFVAILYTFSTGIGTWGNNVPVAWAFAITNFVWWIGMGHAGTFISAILYLLQQKWRSSINRIAEAMTLFAVVQAGLMPILHLGRPWFFYWLIPYPSTMEVWPQFMSTLTFDVAAVFTYLTVSVLFWYQGLVPDLAAARDVTTSRTRRILYGIFALGWNGSARQWRHFRKSQLMIAGLATPLVLSVHSIVSMDFAVANLNGWHSTIWPPYFVAGAIFQGFAMVIQLVVPIRKLYRLEHVITERHIDLCAKLCLATGMVVVYAYIYEQFIAWYSGAPWERWMYFQTRPTGPYAWLFWSMLFCNVVALQAFWVRRARRTPWVAWTVATLIQIGMWLERFVLVVTSQHQDFLPSSWGMYRPSLVDAGLLFGSMSFFAFLMLLLLRFVPFVPMNEIKEDLRELKWLDTPRGAVGVGAPDEPARKGEARG
ncbi:MAG: NrfD/PsrC family molybdoenzyme membrane anchor subunit [Myxococcota bacterium]